MRIFCLLLNILVLRLKRFFAIPFGNNSTRCKLVGFMKYPPKDGEVLEGQSLPTESLMTYFNIW